MHRKSLKVQFSVGRRPEWVRRRTGKLKVPGSIPGARRHRRDGPDSQKSGWPESQKSGFCHTLKLTILQVLGTESAITGMGWSRYGVILKNVYITTMCRSGLCGSSPPKLCYLSRSKVFEKCQVGVEQWRFSKMSGSIFARLGKSRLAFFATTFIKIKIFIKFHFSRILPYIII